MKNVSEAIDQEFPTDREWARAAISQLGAGFDDSTPVHDLVRGWMRLGAADGVLVDTVFVLTADRLGFGQTEVETPDPLWISLDQIVAIDLIEGVPYPLEAIEVQLAGGLAMFVGWPEGFAGRIVELLRRQLEESLAPSDHLPVELSGPFEDVGLHDPSSLDGLAPSNWIEATVDSPTEAIVADRPALGNDLEIDGSEPEAVREPSDPAPSRLVMPPLFASLYGSPEVDDESDSELDTEPDLSTAVAAQTFDDGDDPVGGFDGLGSSHHEVTEPDAEPTPEEQEREAAADRFFAEMEPEPALESSLFALSESEAGFAPTFVSSASDPDTSGPWDNPHMIWPEPFRNVVFLGGHPRHPRRRKGVTMVMGQKGVVAASSGINSWSLQLPWTELLAIEVQGADEVKFTHNHRIDLNSSAVILHHEDGTFLLFEVRSRRPATLRSTLAPVISMVAGSRSPATIDLGTF